MSPSPFFCGASLLPLLFTIALIPPRCSTSSFNESATDRLSQFGPAQQPKAQKHAHHRCHPQQHQQPPKREPPGSRKLRPLSGAQMVLMNLFNLQTQMLNLSALANRSEPAAGDAVTALLTADANASTPMPPTPAEQPRLPAFEMVLGTLTYLLIIGITILGNTLVIVAVFSYRPLKKVQNYFIVSLAASDMLVALVVMPLHVVKFLANGRWLLGVTVCQLFTTADILLCTSSILNLCAIAIDRYWAIHDPIEYAQKRSLKLVGGMIILVWVASGFISVPPLIGWNDWTSQTLVDHCELTSDRAFVVFSACGSFFLPLLVMVVVYLKIFLNARKRIRKNRGRSALFKMNEDLDESRTKRTHKAPVAATSVIALASATGAQIFRKSKRAPVKKEQTSSSTTMSSSQHQHREEEKSAADEEEGEGTALNGTVSNGDSGVCDSNKESPENVVPPPVPTPPPPPAPAVQFQIPPKRHSLLALTVEPSLLTMSSSTSLMAMPNDGKATECVGNGQKAQQPETVELKKHLKEREKISVAKEKRAAKTIAVIIFVFTFCWLPFFCAYVIMPFCAGCYLHPKVHQAFVWLGYINSSLNPFLYGILNLEFRRAFRKILCPKRVQNAQRRRMSEQLSLKRKKPTQ